MHIKLKPSSPAAKRGFSLVAAITFCLLRGPVLGADAPLYKDASAPLEQRVDDLFGRLTQDEKLSLLGGTGFTVQPIPRLDVPAMAMADAGQGVRGGPDGTTGPATAFPAAVLMASTWDTNLIHQVGLAIGDEARNKGQGVLVMLGPAINIHRSPLGGRNGEYFSEDPYLAARLAVAYVQGMQSIGVSACVKHYDANNQETDRGGVNVVVSERALREIYLPAFEAAVKEGPAWSVMTSYNQVNGHHSSANAWLLKQVLRTDWAFSGEVMSDWGGVHETDAVQMGNDLEMPRAEYMTVPHLKTALADGSVTQAAVDESVHRILRTIVRVGLLDGPLHPDASQVNSPAHSQLALDTAEQGIILLKNQRALLPLDARRVKSIAVFGDTARRMQFDALGSPQVQPLHVVEILDGLKARAGGVNVTYTPSRLDTVPFPASAILTPDGLTHGFKAEYFKNRDLDGQPALVRVDSTIHLKDPQLPAPDFPRNNFSARWTGRLVAPATGGYTFAFTGDDGFRVFLDGKKIIDHWVECPPTAEFGVARLVAGKSYELRIEYFQATGGFQADLGWQTPGLTNYTDAVAVAAKNADVAIVCVSTGRMEGEGRDRPTMDLPSNQVDLINTVASANPHTIVVINNGTPVTMKDWLPSVPAVVEAWLPGQEGGTALAAILFGDVNPSGKLPDTLAASRADYSDANNFPGANHQVNYAEGIYVGYRHFDQANIAPIFPFGYGLSYTTFGYAHLKLSQSELAPDGSVTASVDITNTGKRAGAEVVELYVHDTKPKIDKPVRELKGFAKVALQPGETKTVQFTLQPRALAYFDTPGHQWKADAGDYQVQIGASSRDLRQQAVLHLTADYTEKLPSSE